MKGLRNLWAMVFKAGALVFMPLLMQAHTMWLNVSDFSPEFYHGAETKVYFGWGHHYPVDDFLPYEKLEEFLLIEPDGKKVKLTPNPGGFLATQINLKQPGGYIVSAKLKPGFYTMYLEKGEIHHKTVPKTGVEGIIIVSLYYQQFAKALINAGETDDEAFSKPVGHKLEIIPLANPYKLKGCGGHFLPVKVLFDGKPARFVKVYATYSGFSTGEDYAYATSTDVEGIARIRLIHWGNWLLKTEIKLPAPDDKKDKCDELHYTATLTFSIP